MKRRSLERTRGNPSPYHRKQKVAYQYPNWVTTGRDIPLEILRSLWNKKQFLDNAHSVR